MAVTIGTNCGFVAVSPVDDPNGTGSAKAGVNWASKDTAPAGSNKVTEIGWYNSINNNSECAYEVGIYSHDGGTNKPNALIHAKSSGQSVPANTGGWQKHYTGLNITEIVGATSYWAAVATADVVTDVQSDSGVTASARNYALGQPTLQSPWAASTTAANSSYTIYALYEAAAGGLSIPVAMHHYTGGFGF